MNPQERQLVDELFERLAKLENTPRDAEAQAAIAQGLSRAPNAVYALVQTALLQDEALKRAAARIEELEAHAAGQQQESQGGSFLDSMRGAIFGQQQKAGSVPSVHPTEQNRPVWNAGGTYQNAPSQYAPPPLPQADPRAQGGGFGGGSFLGNAAAAAAGVIGGSILMNSIGDLFGGHRQGFGDASSFGRSDSGSPWSSGNLSNSDLARDAGVNDIGRGGRDTDTGGRQAFADQASNEDYDDGDDDDYDADDDSGDSDYA